ncbi:MAG: class II aldolase/adducin family protein [Gemmatimonadaceae bacterium]|nr:class II aldolase/adducin family protein [Gemmatimonadaceae bacterium]
MSREAELRAALVAAGARLFSAGLVAGRDGNLSARLDDDRVLITPRGVSKGHLTPHALAVVRLDGTLVSGPTPSTEQSMHLAAYAARPDVQAAVHAHPPTATGFAVAGETLPDDVLPELTAGVGPVAFVPFGRPGTGALARELTPYWAGHDAFLLANHGALTVGRSVTEALHRMESMEQAARIVLAARQLGTVHRWPSDDVEALRDQWRHERSR